MGFISHTHIHLGKEGGRFCVRGRGHFQTIVASISHSSHLRMTAPIAASTAMPSVGANAAAATTAGATPVAFADVTEGAVDMVRDMERLLDPAAVQNVQSRMIGNVLSKNNSNLKKVLEESEKSLRDAEEDYIKEQCLRADELCDMYHEVVKCETALQGFEGAMAELQKKLSKTSERVFDLQQQTELVVCLMANRNTVASKLSEVYEALNESEAFCDTIAGASVDDEFAKSIRKLERKISFLEDNPELENSAIRAQIRPKLQEAAEKAGAKLHRFLLRKFQGLEEVATNVSLQQQAVLRQGQYAYAFLARYNAPIAEDCLKQYTDIMARVYLRQIQGALGDALAMDDKAASGSACVTLPAGPGEGGVVGQKPLTVSQAMAADLFVLPDMLKGSGAGRGGPVGGSLPIRRSVSLAAIGKAVGTRLKSLGRSSAAAPVMPGQTDGPQRDATFVDNLNALRSVNVQLRLVHIDPAIRFSLANTNSFVARTNENVCKAVNNVLNEGRFIDHFFFSIGGGDTDMLVGMLQTILGDAIAAVSAAVEADVPRVVDLSCILAASRSLDLLRNFVCQSADSIPIELLNPPISELMALLQRRQKEIIAANAAAIRLLAGSTIKPGDIKVLSGTNVVYLSAVYPAERAASLSPSDVTRRFALLTGQVLFVNALRLEGSRVWIHIPRFWFDDDVDALLLSSVQAFAAYLDKMAAAYASPIAAAAFLVNSWTHVVNTWQSIDELPGIIEPSFEPSSDELSRTTTGRSGMFSPSRQNGPVGTQGRPTPMPDFSAMGPANISLTRPWMEARGCLDRAIERFVAADIQPSPAGPLARIMEAAHVALGANGLDASKQGDETDAPTPCDGAGIGGGGNDCAQTTPGAPPPQLVEGEFLAAATQFHKAWKDMVATVPVRLHAFFGEHCRPRDEVLLARQYFVSVVTAARRSLRACTLFFPRNATLRAKLIPSSALEHEIGRATRRESDAVNDSGVDP